MLYSALVEVSQRVAATSKRTEKVSLIADLLDASGKFSPGQDGVNDSYSVGLGFTCVPVIFNMPED